ncbi:MAG: SagB/ThcOx family dehydrogenase [Lentisphaeria bacterium]|nr:SagB/ThcOx family dehydrogenase [Lentisphaeria bacterium]
MNMKSLFSFTAAAVITITASAGDAWKLPAPQKSGGMPVMQALNERSTKRAYTKEKLSEQQISDLLWAANGVNRADGRRTAPSAVNRQEIDLYLLTDKGAFKYDASGNTLIKVNDGDFRKWAGKFASPVYVVLVADMKKAASGHYARIDSGYVSQNIYIYCASSGLGTCAIGSFDRIKGSGKGKKLAEALKLTSDQKVLLTHSVGAVK